MHAVTYFVCAVPLYGHRAHHNVKWGLCCNRLKNTVEQWNNNLKTLNFCVSCSKVFHSSSHSWRLEISAMAAILARREKHKPRPSFFHQVSSSALRDARRLCYIRFLGGMCCWSWNALKESIFLSVAVIFLYRKM